MDIINRVTFTSDHLIDARLASTGSLFDHDPIQPERDPQTEEIQY